MIALLALALLAGEAAPATLRSLAAELRAAGESRARELIDRLQIARSGELGLPDERLGESRPAALRAATLDELLAALDDARARFDRLKPSIDALVATWDLCAVGKGDLDLIDRGGFVEKTRVPPAPGVGLRAFGAIDDQGGPGPLCRGEAPRAAAAAESAPGSHGPPPLKDPPDFITPAFTATPGASGASAVLPPPGPLGIAGRVYASWLLQGRAMAGAAATWTLHDAFFLRGGFGYRSGNDNGGDKGNGAFLTFGAGYEDWRPNTFSLQINHWEPYFPDRGLELRKLLVTAAFKLSRFCKGAFCLGPVVYAETPLDIERGTGYEPTAGARLTFSYGEDFFVLIGAGVVVYGPLRARWVYGAGRLSWRPWTWSATYENWGPNTIPKPNFVDNGQITVGASWAF